MQVSIMISGDSNQSNRCPLSSTNCAAPTAKASAMKPVKSNFLAVPFSNPALEPEENLSCLGGRVRILVSDLPSKSAKQRKKTR